MGQLTDMTERELLILLNEKVQRLEQDINLQTTLAEKVHTLEKRILEQEVKWRVWATVIGIGSSAVATIISKYL
jgi:hypothetical protein